MKVVLIKKCKDGNVNDIIEVSDGYAKNFLIKNGYAKSVNTASLSQRNKNVAQEQEIENGKIQRANKAKETIENTTLEFKLKTTNNRVHGSITKKQVIKSLKLKNINLPATAMEHIHIASIGTTNIKVKLYKDIVANLKVVVKDE